MKKISEMTLEELQDYALDLESKQTTAAEKESELTGKIAELTNTNLTLQKRNNTLFMQLEQQRVAPETPAEPEKTESCEDFAKRIAIGE